MVDVFAQDFTDELVADVTRAIGRASFVAIDTEFTGLTVQGREHYLETMQMRYSNGQASASSFLILQFGVCTFRWVPTARKYEVCPFNFNLFPSDDEDARFLSQSSCLRFLANNGFDFNKCFRDGIPSLTPEREAEERKRLEQAAARTQRQVNVNRASDVAFVEETRAAMRRFVADAADGHAEPLVIGDQSSFRRLLVYQLADNEFGESTFVDSVDGTLYVYATPRAEDRARHEAARALRKSRELDARVGFRRVLDAISEAGVPIVGHNMWLDLIKTVSQFYGRLPGDVQQYRAKVQSLFPLVLDTKHITSEAPLFEHVQNTALAKAHDRMAEVLEEEVGDEPSLVFAKGFDRYADGSAFEHEAAYDAFLTGSLLARCIHFLADGELSGHNKRRSEALLAPYANRIFLMHSDVTFNLAATGDEAVERPNVLHMISLTGPMDGRRARKLAGAYGNLQLAFLGGPASVFLIYPTSFHADVALRGIRAAYGDEVTVSKYARFARSEAASGAKRPREQ